VLPECRVAGTFQSKIAVRGQMGQHFGSAINPCGRLVPSAFGDNHRANTDFGLLPGTLKDGAANGAKTNQREMSRKRFSCSPAHAGNLVFGWF
jgi:hypothetical protein